MVKRNLPKPKTASVPKRTNGPKDLHHKLGALSDPQRRRIHKELDYILDNGPKSLDGDARRQVMFFQGMYYRQVRHEMKIRRELIRQRHVEHPDAGVILSTEALEKLDFGENCSSWAYVRWLHPHRRTATEPLKLALTDFSKKSSGGISLRVDGFLQGPRIDDFIPIHLRNGQATFLCPFPNQNRPEKRCYEEVDTLYLPSGAGAFGCVRCHRINIADLGGFWSQLDIRIDHVVTHEDDQRDEQKRLKKNLAHSSRLDLQIEDLFRDGVFSADKASGTISFEAFSPSYPTLSLKYDVEPHGGNEWTLSLTGHLFNKRVRDSIRVFVRTQRAGKGIANCRRCTCPRCGRENMEIVLLSGANKFCCDKCFDEPRDQFFKRISFYSVYRSKAGAA
jgi:hypothetical protein